MSGGGDFARAAARAAVRAAIGLGKGTTGGGGAKRWRRRRWAPWAQRRWWGSERWRAAPGAGRGGGLRLLARRLRAAGWWRPSGPVAVAAVSPSSWWRQLLEDTHTPPTLPHTPRRRLLPSLPPRAAAASSSSSPPRDAALASSPPSSALASSPPPSAASPPPPPPNPAEISNLRQARARSAPPSPPFPRDLPPLGGREGYHGCHGGVVGALRVHAPGGLAPRRRRPLRRRRAAPPLHLPQRRHPGQHGAGKSAILNSLIGHPVLPTGENGATRAPIVVDLQRDPGLSSKSIVLQIDSKSQQVLCGILCRIGSPRVHPVDPVGAEQMRFISSCGRVQCGCKNDREKECVCKTVAPSKIKEVQLLLIFNCFSSSTEKTSAGDAEPIRTLAEDMVNRMIKKSSSTGGKYVSVHLRFEEDMVAFSCCTYDGGWKEKIEMENARERSWRGKFHRPGRVINPEANRRDGKCPLTPLEVGMMLRGMGFDNTTSLYVASGKIYNDAKYIAPLSQMFPLLATKDTLALPEELAEFEGHSSRLAALDYTVCAQSAVFVTTQVGNFPHFLMGHRRYMFGGNAKTIKPDKRKLVLSFDDPNIRWDQFKRHMQEILHHSDLRGTAFRKPNDSIYAFPMPDCLCQQDGMM